MKQISASFTTSTSRRSTMDLSQQPVYSVPKPSHGRNRPTARQRGAISTKVRRELRERSGGICELCKNNLATEAGHTLRRWRIEERTTVQDVCHLCNACHTKCDTTRDGRKFLEQFRNIQYAKLKYGDDWAEGLMIDQAVNVHSPAVGD